MQKIGNAFHNSQSRLARAILAQRKSCASRNGPDKMVSQCTQKTRDSLGHVEIAIAGACTRLGFQSRLSINFTRWLEMVLEVSVMNTRPINT